MSFPVPGSRAQARQQLRALATNPSGSDLLTFDSTIGRWKNKALSAVMDAVLGSTRGSVLYRGASGWTALGPDTSGKVLQTRGAGADPIWATVSTTGGGGSAFAPLELPLVSHANVTINGTSQTVLQANTWVNPGSVSLTAYYLSATRSGTSANLWLIFWDTTNTRGYVLDLQGDGNIVWYTMTNATNVVLASGTSGGTGRVLTTEPKGPVIISGIVEINGASDNVFSAKDRWSELIFPFRSTTYDLSAGTWELYVMQDASTTVQHLYQVDLLTNPFLG